MRCKSRAVIADEVKNSWIHALKYLRITVTLVHVHPARVNYCSLFIRLACTRGEMISFVVVDIVHTKITRSHDI